jgi:hypothetical protein
MDLLTIVGLLGSLPVALFVIVHVIPEARVSAYRARLWEIRDELVDRTISGEIRPSAAAGDLVADIENRIRFARDLTPYRAVFVALAARVMGAPRVRPRRVPATAVDRAQLHEYEERLKNADVRHVLTGSYSGLLCALFVVPAVLVVLLVKRVCGSKSGNHEPEAVPGVARLEIGYALVVASRAATPSRDREPASACV